MIETVPFRDSLFGKVANSPYRDDGSNGDGRAAEPTECCSLFLFCWLLLSQVASHLAELLRRDVEHLQLVEITRDNHWILTHLVG